MERGLGKTIVLIIGLILAFVGCLVFQVIAQNWMVLARNDQNLLLFLFLVIARPIVSVPIGIWLFHKFESEFISRIEEICFKLTFGYLMFVVPVLGNIIYFSQNT